MTKQELINELKQKYVGKEYNYGCGNWSNIGNEVTEALEKMYNVKLTYSSNEFRGDNNMYIRYKGWGLFKVIIKKKRGECYHGWNGWTYKWNIKDINIEPTVSAFNKETIEEEIEEIDKWTNNKEKEKEDEKAQALKVLKLIMKEFNVDAEEASNIAERIDKWYYKFDKKDLVLDDAKD